MNKTELVAALAEKTQLPKKNAELALNAVVEVITESLSEVLPYTVKPLNGIARESVRVSVFSPEARRVYGRPYVLLFIRAAISFLSFSVRI